MGEKIGILKPLAWSSTTSHTQGIVNEETMDKDTEE